MAHHFQAPAQEGLVFVMQIQQSGTFVNFKIYSDSDRNWSWNNFNLNKVQVGKGTSIPTRQDWEIEDPFTNGGVEDIMQNAGTGGYNSPLGKITVQAVISPTAGSGTVTEVVKFIGCSNQTNGVQALQIIGITRDIVTPVNFIAGKAINTEHEVLI